MTKVRNHPALKRILDAPLAGVDVVNETQSALQRADGSRHHALNHCLKSSLKFRSTDEILQGRVFLKWTTKKNRGEIQPHNAKKLTSPR